MSINSLRGPVAIGRSIVVPAKIPITPQAIKKHVTPPAQLSYSGQLKPGRQKLG